MGLVSGETGRGTFVKEPLPRGEGIDLHAWDADTVDLSFNYPARADQVASFRTALRDLAGAGDLAALLRYQPHGGREHQRASIARHLAGAGLSATPDTVLLVSGAQQLDWRRPHWRCWSPATWWPWTR
jgi:DNA-binding transcriptional MocR family regulator